jgi:hypothetical protein
MIPVGRWRIDGFAAQFCNVIIVGSVILITSLRAQQPERVVGDKAPSSGPLSVLKGRVRKRSPLVDGK